MEFSDLLLQGSAAEEGTQPEREHDIRVEDTRKSS